MNDHNLRLKAVASAVLAHVVPKLIVRAACAQPVIAVAVLAAGALFVKASSPRS